MTIDVVSSRVVPRYNDMPVMVPAVRMPCALNVNPVPVTCTNSFALSPLRTILVDDRETTGFEKSIKYASARNAP